MALPQEQLDNIKYQLDDLDKQVKEATEVVEDLRIAGIDASRQEEQLNTVKAQLRQLKVFYDREIARRSY